METKNNLTTGILIGIGVIVLPLILMSSSTSSNNGIVYGTPESHIYEIYGGEGNAGMLLNKKTGDVWVVNIKNIGSFLKKLEVR